MTTTCPCCGGEVEGGRILVDVGSNKLTYNGVTIELLPRAAEIAYVLAIESPRVVDYNRLIAKVFGHSEPRHPLGLLKVKVSEMRPALAKIGLTIENIRERGYRLRPIAGGA